MLKRGSFIRRKFRQLFAGSLLGAVATGVNTMLDSVLSGNQLGETALTAVSIVLPLTFIILFFSTLTSSGYGIMYGTSNGAFDTESSYRIAGQSVITAAALGALLALLLLLIKQPFLRYYGCAGELYRCTSVYYNWIIVLAALYPMIASLYALLDADADTLLISVSGITDIVLNIVLSTLLCRRFGVSGLGMGTCIAKVGRLCVLLLHFRRSTNSIRFRLCFRRAYFFSSLKLSCTLCCAYLCIGLTDIIMNKIVLISCGVGMLAAYSVINLTYSIYDSFGAVNDACFGFISSFLGEHNNAGLKNVMKTAIGTAAGLGLVISALLLILAPLLPRLYGITNPEVFTASVRAARLMALASVPYGIAYLMESAYPALGRIRPGLAITFLSDLFCPLVLSVPLSFLLGFDGTAVGMAVNAYLAFGLFTLYSICRFGKKGFPLYLQDWGEETVSFDLRVTEAAVPELRDAVRAELDRRGCTVAHLELLLEELYRRILEKNPGKTVVSECALLFGRDYVRIIVRDNGVVFNFIDENNPVESVNAYTLGCLLGQVRDKDYILTTSFNRNGFVFPM